MTSPSETVRSSANSIEMESMGDLRSADADAQKRITELERRLKGQARARAELVQLVSHELRTPITVISGFARLIQDGNHGELNSEQHRFAQEILRACGRLNEFVGDLIEARPEDDSPFSVVAQEADLHRTIEAQLESLAPVLEERGIELEARLHAAPAVSVFDERRIEQVITNLMTNAIRYGRSYGVIRIETKVSTEFDQSRPRDFIHVSIEDDGPGIPEADRERLFDPYVRGENDEKTLGLGIGLSISRRIIHAHGGRIWVETGELGGARFVFSFPQEQISDGEA